MRCRAALAVFLAVLSVSCSRTHRGAAERIALVRFENLSGDPNLDWLETGIPGTTTAQLATSSGVVALPVAAERDVYTVRANSALFGYYSVVQNRLKITADLRDLARQKTIRTIEAEGDVSAGALGLIDKIARDLAGGPVEAFGTHNDAAAREFWAGAQNPKPDEAMSHLNAAANLDPAFVLARITLADRALAAGDSQTAAAQAAACSQNAGSLSPYLRARLALLEVNLHGDPAARLNALVNLTRVAPANEAAWDALADLQTANKDYAAAIQSLKRALDVDDRNPVTLNALGYAYAYSGDLQAAKDAFERYRKVAPQDANAIDSLGDVYFYFGRFTDAERYYLDAHTANPALLGGGDLYKAALAQYYSGDVRAADARFASFLEFRKTAADAMLPIREAVWEAQTARRDRGRRRLEGFLLRTDLAPELRNIAAAQLDLFNVGTGEKLVPIAGPVTLPAARALAQLAMYLSQPDAPPAEWQRRSGGMASPALGYALLLHNHFPEAVAVWERLYASANPMVISDTRVMLAWAYTGAGRSADAQKLLSVRPIPPRMAEPGMSFLTFEKDQALRPR